MDGTRDGGRDREQEGWMEGSEGSRCINKWVGLSGMMETGTYIGGRMEGEMDTQMNGGWVAAWTDEQMGGWAGRRVDGWMNGQMDG